jgi:ferredoxin
MKHKIELPNGTVVECAEQQNLRDSLRDYWDQLYSPGARLFHCRGMGTCGTCALLMEGEVSAPTKVEQWRLGFPPHVPGSGLRLACQARPKGPLKLTKFSGFWGQNRGPHSSPR